jgi:activator of 2-hydroxyglutaryl-CoA dehydratase
MCLIIPENPHMLGALGAAILAKGDYVMNRIEQNIPRKIFAPI